MTLKALAVIYLGIIFSWPRCIGIEMILLCNLIIIIEVFGLCASSASQNSRRCFFLKFLKRKLFQYALAFIFSLIVFYFIPSFVS